MIERLDPSRVMVAGGNDADVRRHIESDFRIRQGLCPNGKPESHGLMVFNAAHEQECPQCGFSTNVMPEKGMPS